MVVHFSAASHIIALSGKLSAVARTAGYVQLFQKVNMFAFHLTVANEEERRRKACKSRSDNIRRFSVHALGFDRMCERFVIACSVIHNQITSDLFYGYIIIPRKINCNSRFFGFVAFRDGKKKV